MSTTYSKTTVCQQGFPKSKIKISKTTSQNMQHQDTSTNISNILLNLISLLSGALIPQISLSPSDLSPRSWSVIIFPQTGASTICSCRALLIYLISASRFHSPTAKIEQRQQQICKN